MMFQEMELEGASSLRIAVRMLRRHLHNDFMPRSFLTALEMVILGTF